MYQFTLELYKNRSENNELQKNITDKYLINGTTRTAIDILKPVIEVYGLDVNAYNYCYIQELKRYYYIEHTVINPNGISVMTLRVDVLMSYIEDIKASSGLITKQKKYNPYYGEYDVESKVMLQKLEMLDPFDRIGEYVLVALRG